MKFDIITFGSAIRDNFLLLEKGTFEIKGKKIIFPFGEKFFLRESFVQSGGGAVNTAITFSLQGFNTAIVSKIGEDKRGEGILSDLKRAKVDTRFLKIDKNHSTSTSFILSTCNERTILISRGACHFIQSDDIPWEKIKNAKWFYLAALNGSSSRMLAKLVEFAGVNNIKIAVNLGRDEIALNKRVLKKVLSRVDVLFLNENEAKSLVKKIFGEGKNLTEKFSFLVKNIGVITLGRRGVVVIHQGNVWRAKILKTKIVERTGAGDAFSSGFLAGLLRKNDIKYAIYLGLANSARCVSEIGSSRGLLKKGEEKKYPFPQISKIPLKGLEIF